MPIAAAADHGDPTGAHQFRDPVGSHPFDKGLDLVLATADFDHDFLGSDIDDFAAEDVDQLTDLAARVARRCLDLHQQQVAFDKITAADIQHSNNRDDLLQLFADLFQDAIVAHDHEGHSRQDGGFRFHRLPESRC